jgi:hypothetical protein
LQIGLFLGILGQPAGTGIVEWVLDRKKTIALAAWEILT